MKLDQLLCSVFLNILLALNTQQVLIFKDSTFLFSEEHMLSPGQSASVSAGKTS